MQIDVSPGHIILIARLPMPPSANRANRAQVRERKNYSTADYLAGKKQYYPVVRKDTRVEAYREEALLRLRCPGDGWQSWQDPLSVRAIRESLSIHLDLELWEYFANDASDTDNRIKELQDILCKHLDIDDHRVSHISASKSVQPRIIPYVAVTLRVATNRDDREKRMQGLLSEYLEERTHDASFSSSTTVLHRTPNA